MDKILRHLQECFRKTKYFLLVLFTVLLLTSGITAKQEIRILFVGDILLSRNVKTELDSKKISPWTNLIPLFHSVDFVVGNLEGAVGEEKNQINATMNSPIFAIDSSTIPLLKEAGFNALTIENNHSHDLGEIGKTKTIETLRKNSLSPIDLNNSPQFSTVNDVVFSLIAVNLVIGRDSLKDRAPSVELYQKLRLARSLSNIVIVSIHWGSELLDWPNREQREIAKWLIKNGADIIIGSHPHIIQKPELIDGKPVFFSLGNNLFDQKYPATKKGLIVDIRIKNNQFYCSGLITHNQENSFYPKIIDTIHFAFDSIPFKTELLKIENYEIKPLSVYKQGDNRIVLKAYKENQLMFSSPDLPLISISVNKLDGERDYMFALENRFSTIDNKRDIRPYVYSVDDKGIFAKWRGSALAWPLIDAIVSSSDNRILCALHRGDSFIRPDITDSNYRIATYKWDGFGFRGVDDSLACKVCGKNFKDWQLK